MKQMLTLLCMVFLLPNVQAQKNDSTNVYKKRVLESTEVDLLMSLYNQDGSHSPVNGGIGTEKLKNGTPTIVISIPLNDDDILTIDAGISAYTSASSSNINPFKSVASNLKNASINGTFNISGASRGGGGTVVQPTTYSPVYYKPAGTPWLASTGASQSDVLKTIHADYSHSSESRNFVWGTNASFSTEYDYTSFGVGGNLTGLFNEKNTEIGLKGSAYFDQWRPIYPTELREYNEYGSNFQSYGYFKGVTVMNGQGSASTLYLPSEFVPWDLKGRNSYSLSFFVSQIINRKMQGAFFFDLVLQNGMLSTPYHRIYFADKQNYFIGFSSYISKYTSVSNTGVYQLADDIERLPTARYKFPFGTRLNYYVNEYLSLRTYYRYYLDNWGLKAHTINLDLPFKISQAFSITPSYRYYRQNQVDYFAPFETHLSTEEFYTSDYDLAKFISKQYSIALNYTDIFTAFKISMMGFKNVNLKYSHYTRSDGLKANIFTLGFKFINEK